MKLFEEDGANLIEITPQWLRGKYEIMNRQLFNGELGPCILDVFTNGRGSQGRTLGRFSCGNIYVKYNRSTRRMYVETSQGRRYVTRENFAEIFKPTIKLNGNYRWSEKSALTTLVHEMCHYYNNKDGYVPTRSHGEEFMQIARMVSARSNDIFPITAIATAERMKEMSLNQKQVDARNKRLQTAKNKVIPTFVYKKDRTLLVNCSTLDLLNRIVDIELPRGSRVLVSKDPALIDFLFSNGYKKTMTTYRAWDVSDKEWLPSLTQNYRMSEMTD